MPIYRDDPVALMDEEERMKIVHKYAKKGPESFEEYAEYFENIWRPFSWPTSYPYNADPATVDYPFEFACERWCLYYYKMYFVCLRAAEGERELTHNELLRKR